MLTLRERQLYTHRNSSKTNQKFRHQFAYAVVTRLLRRLRLNSQSVKAVFVSLRAAERSVSGTCSSKDFFIVPSIVLHTSACLSGLLSAGFSRQIHMFSLSRTSFLPNACLFKVLPSYSLLLRFAARLQTCRKSMNNLIPFASALEA